MSRIAFIVDGFNLYHSLVDAQKHLKKGTKWLDLRKLCSSYFPLIQERTGSRPFLESIHYFSASPTHRNSDRVFRHALYMDCLRATGVSIRLGRFKRKRVTCRNCNSIFTAHEEKESDVAIGVKLIDLCYRDECDIAVIISGDTDLLPAVEICKSNCPSKAIFFAFPYKRKNKELEKHATGSFTIKPEAYRRCQLPYSFTDSDGNQLTKPSRW